jgi:hypothetical protein
VSRGNRTLRRIVAKAKWTHRASQSRFAVTLLGRDECKAKYLCEKLYCARGDMENRIKECQLDLYADRTSTATHPGQSTAPVACLHGLRAALCLAPYRPA